MHLKYFGTWEKHQINQNNGSSGIVCIGLKTLSLNLPQSYYDYEIISFDESCPTVKSEHKMHHPI